MNRGSTLFLKVAIVLIGMAVLALSIFLVPRIANEAAGHYPFYWICSVLTAMYAAAIPFYFALYQALKLLSFIDLDKAFSGMSVRALKNIKNCAIIISLLYVIILPFFYLMAEHDDAPGILFPGIIIVFASAVIAVFAAVLEKLLKRAIEIKYENDLTV